MESGNLQVIFATRPKGWVTPQNFALREAPVARPQRGEVLVRNIYLSLDPYMRGAMDAQRSYAPGFALDQVLQGRAVGSVVESGSPRFHPGDFVFGMLGWEQFSIADGGDLTPLEPGPLPLSYHLGVLGMPGLTAHVGMLEIGNPRPGESVYVSAASGAVGQIAGQLARLEGARVVGSAGSNAKVAYLTGELGFDSGFNHRTAESYGAALDAHCPNGIDVYFENVGGAMLQAVLSRMNEHGRIACCGMVSQYNLEEESGVRGLTAIVRKRLTLKGFIVRDHADLLPAYRDRMSGLLQEGKVHYREDIRQGLEQAPEAFIAMLKGENFGKQIVQISEDPLRG